MTKYRLLNNDELAHFEEEFIKYLVVNGIAADDWRKLVQDKPDDAQKIVDLFSDVVFEKIMRQTDYLDFRSPSYIQSIHCLPEKMITVALSVQDKSIDLSVFDWQSADPKLFVVHKAEKAYTANREKELFELTEKGFVPSDGKLYKALMLASV
ncbi:MAG: DUF6495 family protein [Crocinitomicaceae bacterium]